MKLYMLFILTCIPIVLSKDIHRQKFDRHQKAEHHDSDFDHEAIWGSQKDAKEYTKLKPEDAQRKLKALTFEMDLNNDTLVDSDELTSWIEKSFARQDEIAADEDFDHDDANQDGNLTWREYLLSNYKVAEKDVQTMPEDSGTLTSIKNDQARFNAADVNGDKVLEKAEHRAFLFPVNYKHMHSLEVDQQFTREDRNKNGVLDLAEHLADYNLGDDGDQSDDVAVATEDFQRADKDKDGVVNKEEAVALIKSDYLESGEIEAKHLIKETDMDGDGKLSQQEILDKYELWIGSAATDVIHEEL